MASLGNSVSNVNPHSKPQSTFSKGVHATGRFGLNTVEHLLINPLTDSAILVGWPLLAQKNFFLKYNFPFVKNIFVEAGKKIDDNPFLKKHSHLQSKLLTLVKKTNPNARFFLKNAPLVKGGVWVDKNEVSVTVPHYDEIDSSKLSRPVGLGRIVLHLLILERFLFWHPLNYIETNLVGIPATITKNLLKTTAKAVLIGHIIVGIKLIKLPFTLHTVIEEKKANKALAKAEKAYKKFQASLEKNSTKDETNVDQVKGNSEEKNEKKVSATSKQKPTLERIYLDLREQAIAKAEKRKANLDRKLDTLGFINSDARLRNINAIDSYSKKLAAIKTTKKELKKSGKETVNEAKDRYIKTVDDTRRIIQNYFPCELVIPENSEDPTIVKIYQVKTLKVLEDQRTELERKLNLYTSQQRSAFKAYKLADERFQKARKLDDLRGASLSTSNFQTETNAVVDNKDDEGSSVVSDDDDESSSSGEE